MTVISLGSLAEKLNAQLHGDGNVTIRAVASLENAKEGDLTFLSSSSYKKYLAQCEATAVLIKENDLSSCKTNALVVKDPYLAYALVAQLFDTTPDCAKDIAPSAYIAPTATIGKNVAIGHNAVIEEGAVLGDNVQIGAGSFVGKNSKIGNNTRLWANVTIYHNVEIGDDCLFQSAAVIGAEGFGYANDRGRWEKIPQVGRVIIGNNVEIGASTTIDRGAIDDTIIGNGVIIDNQCQIGHNVQIGDHTAMAAASAVGGGTKIGKHCMIAGACAFNGHIDICDNVVITGMSMIMRPISEPGVYSSGIPLQPNKEWRKTAARVMKIEEMHKRLKLVENQLKKTDYS